MFKNILIKKRKLFIRNRGKWLNVNLEVSANGGGWNGFKTFFTGLYNCRKDKHRYQTVFNVQSLTSCIQCCYCKHTLKSEYDLHKQIEYKDLYDNKMEWY